MRLRSCDIGQISVKIIPVLFLGHPGTISLVGAGECDTVAQKFPKPTFVAMATKIVRSIQNKKKLVFCVKCVRKLFSPIDDFGG